MTALRCWIMTLLAPLALHAVPIAFQSSTQQTSLVELYTSEGCSSCPPAETWLSRLKDAPGLWSDFVPVAFHVDYWNSLGWRDPWSREEFSDRQRAYAAGWGSDTIYTPEFVLNGREWSHRFWQKSVPTANESNAGVLSVRSDDARRWQVTFAPAQGTTSIYEVHAALLVSGVNSDVKAGENAGHQLKHDFVVVAFTEIPLVSHHDAFKSEFVLDAGQKNEKGRVALAVWITPQRKSEPVQAVGGWLPNPGITN